MRIVGSERNTRIVAVAGIDGSGKSSVVRRFAARGQGTLAITCPTYHETPNAPFARLSERLHRLSRACDGLRSVELKGAAMYLQMTLHGPVEHCLIDAYDPELVFIEHHSIVASLAYGAIYTTLIRKQADASLEAPLRAALDEGSPGSYDEILQWAALHARRVGITASIFELGLALTRLLERPREEVIAELSRRYGTGLPDALVVLDLPASVAVERLRQRGDPMNELHEQAPMLDQLRRLYLEVADYLAREHSEVEIIVIDSAVTGSVDDIRREIMRRIGLDRAGD